MTNTNHKTHVSLIALIMAGVASLLFLILREVTTLFLVAYGFALMGIAVFWWSNIHLLDNIKSYPWAVALTLKVWQYLVAELVLSAVFVVLEQFSLYSIPIVWFILLHALTMAFFAVPFILLKSGKDVIEQRGAEVKEKTLFLQSLLADLSAVLEKTPEAAQELKSVMDAVRYSDPMSHASLLPYENDIKDSVVRLDLAAEKKDTEEISSLCVTLLRQIKDRNNRVKLLK